MTKEDYIHKSANIYVKLYIEVEISLLVSWGDFIVFRLMYGRRGYFECFGFSWKYLLILGVNLSKFNNLPYGAVHVINYPIN